ncbi:nucleolar protein dao-5 [Drosophila ficusphila]|uniref:nucleolar protein dao-5 n=1 Tax=Drosophila ficusphila TaxID=30025 RepID=UPI0007E6AA1B|nr:nucleolar protein dao-5 [Drosophila ficusphila]
MSAAELEAESAAQEQQPQQQSQQGEESNTNTAIDENATTTNSYNNNLDPETQLQLHQDAQQSEIEGNSNNGMAGLGISLMNSSPPPHSYRHSRAYRHFKNPPQPHMCIRTTTESGEELFINVLSWTRIVIPQEPSDPIPLYGGMRVPPGSPRSPPIVFAVMANPEVLKDSGRHSKDPEERRAMVELMCDFVEAMNPGVKLVRNAVILKDRDISGELKDVWNAVQAQRDREREEQMMQQRQQQHYQNITTQQMFPKSPDAARAASAGASVNEAGSPPAHLVEPLLAEHGNSNGNGNGNGNGITLAVFAQQLDNKVASEQAEQQEPSALLEEACVDQTDAGSSANGAANVATNGSAAVLDNQKGAVEIEPEIKFAPTATTNGASTPTASNSTPPPATATTTSNPSPAPAPASAPVATPTPPPAAPAKKDKLGGFLPNGCIFPRFKNNKHKDKDSSHKEGKSKEKTLLNALKKSKEKKVAPSEQPSEKSAAASDNGTTQYEKNCINNLECEVQKLDLNSGSNGDNSMFIKLKVSPANANAATAAAAK